MVNSVPKPFKTIGQLAADIVARQKLIHEMAQALDRYDPSDRERCLQALVVDQGVKAEREEILDCFDEALELRRQRMEVQHASI